MPKLTKHTIQLKEEEIRVINIIKAVNDLKSIDKAVSFIIDDYAKTKPYSKFIDDIRKIGGKHAR
jgi:hypothetical protein|tara:strand:- start:660 stop:854 length:195 start_codon:yes stop_codon:yes gene_type:complete